LSRDVENDATAAQELLDLGLSTVPVTTYQSGHVVGFNPLQLKELLHLSSDARWEADPHELFEALDQLMTAVPAAIRQIPHEQLTYRSPDRDRDLRTFGVHIVHRVQRGLDSTSTLTFGPSSKEIYDRAAQPYATSVAIAEYGAEIQQRLHDWRVAAGNAPLEQTVDAYMGRITLLQLFEMITNHTAHHLRQLYVFMRRLGLEPREPLAVEQLRGVTVLQSVF
jgi:hypothetical protein